MVKSSTRLLRLQRRKFERGQDTEIRHEHVIQQAAAGCRHAMYSDERWGLVGIYNERCAITTRTHTLTHKHTESQLQDAASKRKALFQAFAAAHQSLPSHWQPTRLFCGSRVRDGSSLNEVAEYEILDLGPPSINGCVALAV